MAEIYFPGVRLSQYKRFDPARGEVKFRCVMSQKNWATLCSSMGWTMPGDKCSLERFDGKLKGGYFVMTANLDQQTRLALKSRDGTFDSEASYEIGFDELSDFECHRLELKERKNNAFVWELRFAAKFHAESTVAELERYQFATDNARFGLRVKYKIDPEQIRLGVEADQMNLMGVK